MAKLTTLAELKEVNALLAACEGTTEALTKLETFYCDRTELMELLVRIRRAWLTESFSRADLEDISELLDAAGKKLQYLPKWGESRNLRNDIQQDPNGWLTVTGATLQKIAGTIRKDFIPTANETAKPSRLDRAKRRLAEYVNKHTKKWHDRRLALLIEAVTEQSYKEDAQRHWRVRHMK